MRIEEKEGNLVITDFNELEAYKIACKIEADGIDFYKSKEVFNFLLAEEQKHLKLFNELLFKLKEGREDSFEGDDLLSTIDYGIFMPVKKINSPREALQLGIIIEDRSIKFYEFCKDRVSSNTAKKEISNIISEEHKHKELLEEMLKK